MFEVNAGGFPFVPQIQRYRDYARQRQMTLGDLLLENRIIFLGSSPETGGNPAIILLQNTNKGTLAGTMEKSRM